jgi:hypothetical protein
MFAVRRSAAMKKHLQQAGGCFFCGTENGRQWCAQTFQSRMLIWMGVSREKPMGFGGSSDTSLLRGLMGIS